MFETSLTVLMTMFLTLLIVFVVRNMCDVSYYDGHAKGYKQGWEDGQRKLTEVALERTDCKICVGIVEASKLLKQKVGG